MSQGFRGIMANFNNERLMLAQNCVSLAQVRARVRVRVRVRARIRIRVRVRVSN